MARKKQKLTPPPDSLIPSEFMLGVFLGKLEAKKQSRHDLFAAAALTGLLSSGHYGYADGKDKSTIHRECAPDHAIEIADIMTRLI